MNRLLLSFAAIALLFVACEPSSPAEENATLTITSGESMQISHEAGAHTITYTLEGAKEGALPKATCTAEWVSNISVSENISFEVAENEGDARTAIICISYGKAEQSVIVRQLSASEAALKASYFGGLYYGSIFSPELGNYYVHLSDNGFTDSGMDKPNSKSYALDLYGPLDEDNDGEITLPIGTYTLNTDSKAAIWTIGYNDSGYRESNEDGASLDPLKYDNAKLVVTEDRATLTCTIEGTEHKVVFEGKAEIIDERY
jgi:hypothetical protein